VNLVYTIEVKRDPLDASLTRRTGAHNLRDAKTRSWSLGFAPGDPAVA